MLHNSEHRAYQTPDLHKEGSALSELRDYITRRADAEKELFALLAQPGRLDLKPLTDLWLEQQLNQAQADRLLRLLIDRASGLSGDS